MESYIGDPKSEDIPRAGLAEAGYVAPRVEKAVISKHLLAALRTHHVLRPRPPKQGIRAEDGLRNQSRGWRSFIRDLWSATNMLGQKDTARAADCVLEDGSGKGLLAQRGRLLPCITEFEDQSE